MKTVSELYDTHSGADIYIVGTGPSLRIFPKDFFDNKIVIGLNQAWKYVSTTYTISIHPDHIFPVTETERSRAEEIVWVFGYRKAVKLMDEHVLRENEKKIYYFWYEGQENTASPIEPSNAGKIIDWVLRPSGDNLYTWSSISQTAMNFAANLGAKNIFLVGCDNVSMLGNHHNTSQHTRWKGVSPDTRYHQYYLGMEEVRAALATREVNIFTMSSFLGFYDLKYQFKSECMRLNLNIVEKGRDISSPWIRFFYARWLIMKPIHDFKRAIKVKLYNFISYRRKNSYLSQEEIQRLTTQSYKVSLRELWRKN